VIKNFILKTLLLTLLVGCGDNRRTAFVEDIGCYSDFSTVDWDSLRDRYYRPNTADWPADVDSMIYEDFPMEIACEYWHLLQNARTDFHQKSLPLRVRVSEDVIAFLNSTEAMFDTVFVRCVSQEYYMRLFPEMYNETMKPALDDWVEKLNDDC
jgi:hypothetical protein